VRRWKRSLTGPGGAGLNSTALPSAPAVERRLTPPRTASWKKPDAN